MFHKKIIFITKQDLFFLEYKYHRKANLDFLYFDSF